MTVVASIGLAALFFVNGTAMVAAVPPMKNRATHLGVSMRSYRVLGCLQLLAVIGLVLGIARYPLIGVAASIGLFAMMFGAVLLHGRKKDPLPVLLPALLVAALSLLVTVLFVLDAT